MHLLQQVKSHYCKRFPTIVRSARHYDITFNPDLKKAKKSSYLKGEEGNVKPNTGRRKKETETTLLLTYVSIGQYLWWAKPCMLEIARARREDKYGCNVSYDISHPTTSTKTWENIPVTNRRNMSKRQVLSSSLHV